jgi:hypothetical protein
MTTSSIRTGGAQRRRSVHWLWLGPLLIIVIAWLFLVFTSQGLLIRYEPLAASESEPSFVASVACTYSSGIQTVAVFSFGNWRNAECSQFHKFGSVPRCPAAIFGPLVCEAVPGQFFSIDPRLFSPTE